MILWYKSLLPSKILFPAGPRLPANPTGPSAPTSPRKPLGPMTPCFPSLPGSPFRPCNKAVSTGPIPRAVGEENKTSKWSPLKHHVIRPLHKFPGLAPGSPFCPLTPSRPSLPGIPAGPGTPLIPLQFTSHWPLAIKKVRPNRAARPLKLLMVPVTAFGSCQHFNII